MMFKSKIITIQNGKRYMITIPKKLVSEELIDPSKEYIIVFKEIKEEEKEECE